MSVALVERLLPPRLGAVQTFFLSDTLRLRQVWVKGQCQAICQQEVGAVLRDGGQIKVLYEDLHTDFAPETPFPKDVFAVMAETAYQIDAAVLSVQVIRQSMSRQKWIQRQQRVEGLEKLEEWMVRVQYKADGQVYEGRSFGGQSLAWQPETLALQAVQQAQHLAKASPFPYKTGLPLTVILPAGWGGIWLHEVVGHLLEADVILAGKSHFYKKLGQEVAPSFVSILDDPCFASGRVSYEWDDEGTHAQPCVLIEKGRLLGFLTHQASAEKLGLSPTAHARCASFRDQPLARMSNLILQPQNHPPSDLWAGIKQGVYVQDLGKARLLPNAQQYEVEVRTGFWIEDGQCTQALAHFKLIGRVEEALWQIEAIANDFGTETGRGQCGKAGQILPISVSQPSIRLRNMTVLPLSP